MTARPSTPSLSRLLELLELEQPRVVSRQRLEEWAQEAGSAPAGVTVPPALRAYRIVRWAPRAPLAERESLPVWSASTLVAFMAARPSLYRDWPNTGEWLGTAVAALEIDLVRHELEGRSRAAWARAAYLLDRGGQADLAAGLLEDAPRGSGPYYLGPRDRAGCHSSVFDVVDSTGLEVRDR